jgi:hypothetical protein
MRPFNMDISTLTPYIPIPESAFDMAALLVWLLAVLITFSARVGGVKGIFKMARKKSSNSKGGQREWHGFVNIMLPPGCVEDLRARYNSLEACITEIARLTCDGYKFTLSQDTYNDAFICSMSTKDAKSVNSGWVLTGRGGNFLGAMASALYKHVVVCDGGSWDETTTAFMEDYYA